MEKRIKKPNKLIHPRILISLKEKKLYLFLVRKEIQNELNLVILVGSPFQEVKDSIPLIVAIHLYAFKLKLLSKYYFLIIG